MNNIQRLQNLISNIKPDLFNTSPKHDYFDIIIKWIPIIAFKEKNLCLGLSKNGFWLRYSDNDVFEFVPGELLVFLLPCLEIPRDFFFAKIKESLNEKGLSIEIIATFPLEDLYITALKSMSEHWMSQFLNWIDISDISPNLVKYFEVFVKMNDKRISQNNRQKVLKLLKNYEMFYRDE
jgi:hypothetical protein